jgi:hypothetical protein
MPWAAALLGFLVLLAATAIAQPSDGRRDQPPPDGDWSPPTANFQNVLAGAQGILLVDGHYVPLPITMRVEDGQLLANDLPVTSNPDQLFNRPRFRQPTPRQVAHELGMQLAGQLANPHVVVAIANQPLVVLTSPGHQDELLRKLARLCDGPTVHPVAYEDNLPRDLDRAIWNRWLADFSPTPEFVSRVTAYLERFDRVEREGQAAIAATRRLYDFSYPLSLIGMVAAVLGFGHLLTHRPPVEAKALDIDASPLALRVLTYSLVLIVLYSALDLTWSILAYQAGQMLELNPLGSHLIDDPLRLIAFKGGATGVSVGLLFYLRKYRKAQLAAWWICLILTLLTARWLMMNSMFVA